MTVDEAIKVAGPDFKLEGMTDETRVIGFRVLSRDGREIAMFIDNKCAALVQPLPLGADTSSL